MFAEAIQNLTVNSSSLTGYVTSVLIQIYKKFNYTKTYKTKLKFKFFCCEFKSSLQFKKTLSFIKICYINLF